MISVQNHRQLSNGNKAIYVLLMIFLFSSCGIFSGDTGKRTKHTKRRKPPVHKKKKNDTGNKPDTLQWTDKTKQVDKIDLHGTVKKNTYVVDLLIPFDANKNFENIEELEKSRSNRFLHYYSGVLLALENLEKEGGQFVINVFDAPVKNDRIALIKSKMNLDPPDIIVGPYSKNQLKNIANFGKRKEIDVVSPWKSISSAGNHNPFFIQLKPSLENHYEALVKNVDSHFDPGEVYVLGQDNYKDKARANRILNIHKKNNENAKDYNVLLIKKDSLQQESTVFFDVFAKDKNKKKVFILPNWSYKDESFIYSCLRKLNIEKGEKDVYVYGMPILLKSNKIGYNFFKRLNIRVASPRFLDDNNYKIRKFKYDFYQKYKVFPLDEAYDGYDMMMFVGENLMKYGTKFQYFIENQKQEFLANSVKLVRKVKDEDIKMEKPDEINYFENSDLFIVGFKFNKFEKIK